MSYMGKYLNLMDFVQVNRKERAYPIPGEDPHTRQGVFLDHNDSERFECRFVSVKVSCSPAIMFSGMEDTVFGMWSAHGEGLFNY